ncbi:MAG: branched-chain alpha-keto acid dehydrogenase subunit E2 [Candidatus Bathyarchaeota archaeon BA1]|nr:MAG: branched-chain alpha-keto acid dehydrogenase subunit E2 [Candidatus Bathyarchaeota archaeon BA1]
MVTRVVMPRLSLTMKEGTVVQWFKREGELVKKGEPLVEVLSEKVTYDVEAPASGVLRKILALEGADVPVAEAIGIIAAPDEEPPEIEAVVKVPTEEVREAVAPEREAIKKPRERVIASPAAKRLAREYGIDLAKVGGTGPEGRIVEEDVRRVIEGVGIAPRIRQVIPLTGVRKTVAERVSLSARTAPHSTITMEVDMSNAMRLHEETKVSYTDMVVKAVAKALVGHPIMNSTLEGGQIKVFEDINIGVAIATEKGLVVPVIHNADKKSLAEIASITKEIVERAREGKLTKEELTGGTFTITNLGMFDVDTFTPIINPPETAILGVGRIVEKPVAIGKEIVVRPRMHLSLSFDHRVTDGAPAAQFLQKVKKTLEDPQSLLTSR